MAASNPFNCLATRSLSTFNWIKMFGMVSPRLWIVSEHLQVAGSPSPRAIDIL